MSIMENPSIQLLIQTALNQMKSKIEYPENRINELVYQLYGLSESEIKIIENNLCQTTKQ